MRILMLAPHPFYQERGTPIAVNLLLEVLSGQGHQVDLLTYPEGTDVAWPGVTVHRIRRPPGVRNIPPGPSWKKIVCDLTMWPEACALARRNRYDLVHAVEEAVLIAAHIRRRYRIPYLYDMDSDMARQVAEKFPVLHGALPFMRRTLRGAVRGALAVIPVCDALAEVARQEGASRTWVLHDISLLGPSTAADDAAASGLMPSAHPRFMYVGNLESYQGADLMLRGFRCYRDRGGRGTLVVAGGKPDDIARYRDVAAGLGLGPDVAIFLGPQPVSRMAALFREADVLVSPRLKGNNTPMKIYSYLASGKCVLATDLETHTQVLTPEVAVLTPVDADAFGEAMWRLDTQPDLRERLGRAGRELAERDYSRAAFRRTLDELYGWVEQQVRAVPGASR